MSADDTILSRLERLFTEGLHLEAPSPDADLIATGLIDSMTLVELLLLIEKEYQIVVPIEELELDMLQSTRRISDLIRGRLA